MPTYPNKGDNTAKKKVLSPQSGVNLNKVNNKNSIKNMSTTKFSLPAVIPSIAAVKAVALTTAIPPSTIINTNPKIPVEKKIITKESQEKRKANLRTSLAKIAYKPNEDRVTFIKLGLDLFREVEVGTIINIDEQDNILSSFNLTKGQNYFAKMLIRTGKKWPLYLLLNFIVKFTCMPAVTTEKNLFFNDVPDIDGPVSREKIEKIQKFLIDKNVFIKPFLKEVM